MPPPGFNPQSIHQFFDPLKFGTELGYALIILIFCLLVYWKTKEIYELTKHKGIKYFRFAFLFFGLSYAFRLILFIMIVGTSALDLYLPRHLVMPFSNLIVAYFSTLAILYLTYSIISKKIKNKHFMIFANLLAITISLIAFLSRSPFIISMIQLMILIGASILNLIIYKKKISRTRILYFLITLFWLLNLFTTGRYIFLPFETQIIIYILAIIIFAMIYHRVSKFTK